MKKTLLFAVLFSLAATFSFAQKFAYIDSEFILENIPEYSDAKNEIDDLSMQWQKEIETKFAEIEQLYKNFRAEAVLLPKTSKPNARRRLLIRKRKQKTCSVSVSEATESCLNAVRN